MSKKVIIYGTSTGVTKDVASKIQKAIGEDIALIDIANAKVDDFTSADFLILGASTTGYGDLQDDWESFLPKLDSVDLSGKTVAIFGLGDSSSYSDTFANSMKPLYDAVVKAKAKVVGAVSTEGYTFDDSASVVDGNFVGLALDEDNEYDQTDERISAWVSDISKFF